jgi:hypothetical protein
MAAVTATFLKCDSFKKLNGRESGRESVLAGKMAVMWQF